MDKFSTLKTALRLVKDEAIIAFGGNALYRSPILVAKRLALSGTKNLHIVKTAIAHEADILCGAGCVACITAGFVGYETQFGLCNFYRKSIECGETEAHEHACYSVITAFRAAAQGVPFLPIRGMLGSDLIEAVHFKTVTDPYTGEELCAVKAIVPDVAFLHVHKADRFGNAEISGPMYEDAIIARCAKTLVLTCEETVPDDYFGWGRKADIPENLVDFVVHLPKGAAPGACEGLYDVDDAELERFKKLQSREELMGYLAEGTDCR